MQILNVHFSAYPLDAPIFEFVKDTLSDLIAQNINIRKYRPGSIELFRNKTENLSSES